MLTIKMTPQELRDAADFITTKKEAIDQEVAALNSKIEEVTASWEGAAQSQFVITFTDTFSPMLTKDFPAVMEGIVKQLDGAADAIEDADQQVADAFKIN
ncbi:WXG100 family type VII secretion target [Anaerosporobacter faecicola]|uniref:WXG100 family type VII secretion target n=1 Tax=Anaerosporobacter faecicola TaxID=2718714 RepID=UPI00143A261B|nr:WXG100 family type VII secretion target [Anaerosporobacter faecicola]